MIIRHINQLIALDDRALVEALYRSLLQREPDSEGLEFYIGQLRAGYDKTWMIVEFASSPEAQTVGQALPGLRQFVANQKALRGSFWRRVSHNHQHERQLNRIENTLGRTRQDIDDFVKEMRQRLAAIEAKVSMTPGGGIDADRTPSEDAHERADSSMQPGQAASDADLMGVPLLARRIFRELSAAVAAIGWQEIK